MPRSRKRNRPRLNRKRAAAQAPSATGAAGRAQQKKEIKDPAEYNAYVGAVQQQDPAAKISGLEAFLTQYPNSVMKEDALEILMGTYQQKGDVAKMGDAAKRLLTANPNNVRALALLAYSKSRPRPRTSADRQSSMPARKKVCRAEQLHQARQHVRRRLQQPEEATSGHLQSRRRSGRAQRQRFRQRATNLCAPRPKLHPTMSRRLSALVRVSEATPPDCVNGLWFTARAANLAPTPKASSRSRSTAPRNTANIMAPIRVGPT